MFLKICKFLITSCLITALVSCASTTTIRAIDQNGDVDKNVKIYVDGSYQGKGKISYSDSKIVGSTTKVKLKKEGCKSDVRNISRSEKIHIGALIGGFFFFVPFLWIMGYNPMHSYEFQCDET